MTQKLPRLPIDLYLGTFLIALATLANEILLTRMLSVAGWYYLAYFAISLAMLGMTAGAVTVYLFSRSFEPARLAASLANASLASAWAIAAALILTCFIPLLAIDQGRSIMPLVAMITLSAVCALPYYFAGIAITGVLTRSGLAVGKIYAADLVGSAIACVLVLLGFRVADPYSLSLLAAAVAAIGASRFARAASAKGTYRFAVATALVLVAAALGNASTRFGIRPIMVKGNLEDPDAYLLERWNSFSRISVGRVESGRQYLWGPSPTMRGGASDFHKMVIDGNAASWVRKFNTPDDIEALRYDITNAGYQFERKGLACVIGVGGGRDVQAAVLFGHSRVVGIDVNPIFIDLLKNEFLDFAGLGRRPDVTLVADEARSYLSRATEPCAVIQMSLIDTWASTAAGAFSLSENSLYTVEAFKIFHRRLTEDGILMVSRWFWPNDITETGRIVSLATAALLELGVKEPAQHIALVKMNNLSTLVMSKTPFSAEDIDKFWRKMSEMKFDVILLPGRALGPPVFQAILAAQSRAAIDSAVDGQVMNLTPTTDDMPYFFNTLKLANVGMSIGGSEDSAYVGNLRATQYLLNLIKVLLVLVLVTIVVPLLLKTRSKAGALLTDTRFLAGAAYFSLIGSGFMFTEVALIQKFNLFLGHPTFSLSVILFTLILSTGAGSLLSERLVRIPRGVALVYPLLIAAVVLTYRFLTVWVIDAAVSLGMPGKVLISVLMLFPLGIILGVCFPFGIRLTRKGNEEHMPWYWALNGIFGVLSATIAVFTSIYFGISVSMYIAAGCYLLLSLCNLKLATERPWKAALRK